MKKGLFFTDERYTNINFDEANGVKKKINSQVKALNITEEMTCRLLVLPKIQIRHIFGLFVGSGYKQFVDEISNIDFIYFRRIIPVNNSLIKFLKEIKKNNNNCKIVYEIPTYPYDKEYRGFVEKISLCIDRFFRNELKKYVDRIVVVSNDDPIVFGIRTIKIINGVDCTDIPVQIPVINDKDIHLIVVAQFAHWHGYDRLIEGMNNYYKKEQSHKVYIHFVGGGSELQYYKHLIRQYNLSAYVFFYSLLYGEELANVFNKVNLAVCSLGSHRKGIYLSSELKSREYLARGLPIISSARIDVLPPDYKYVLYVPENESAIDIEYVVAFYENLSIKQSVPNMINEIRKFTEENCDISKTMRPVIEYLK
ncbi:MAG: glycosyltransferase [Bacteroidales bacterium]|jgi:glycosyltransferase involved in cell wall biosynthesis|nr:glycosyltransferase [Bacteroidales bacterium]